MNIYCWIERHKTLVINQINSMKTMVKAGIFVAGALLLSAGSASAISYTLNNLNSSAYTGPYGTVSVVLDTSSMATITFTSENGYLFVDGSSDAVNVNATSFGASIISDNAPGGLSSFDQFTSGNVSEWGNFNLILDQNNTSPSDRASIISFSVTDNSGTWSSAADVLDANNDGSTVAAHIIVPGGAFTGYASDGSTSNNVPDGGNTALLLGAALSAIGVIRSKLSRSI
jgi:VPDSG-CTERM motif